MTRKVYLLAEAEGPRNILADWRKKLLEAEYNLQDFMDKVGAESAEMLGGFDKPHAFFFPGGRAPNGWSPPSPTGASRPMFFNHGARSALDSMKWCPDFDRLVTKEFDLPTGMIYGNGFSRGSVPLTLGSSNTFDLLWSGDYQNPANFVLVTPDYEAAKDRYKALYRGISWTPEGSFPTVPEGFRRISPVELDALFAEDLEDARRKAAEAGADMPPAPDAYSREDLVEAYGYALDPGHAFRGQAPHELIGMVEQSAIGDGGYSWVIWDPADGADGFFMTGDSESGLRRAFVSHARSNLAPLDEREEIPALQ